MRRVLSALAVMLVAALALAQAGTATAARGATRSARYSIATSSVGDQTLVMRWNPCQERITYQVNAAGAGRTAAARRSALADARRAFDLLGDATGITFTFTGTTDVVPTGSDWPVTAPAEIVVAWIDDRAGRSSTLLQHMSNGMAVAATGGYSFKRWTFGKQWTGATGRGFVVVDAHAARIQAGFGAGLTRGNLLLHELGHVMGLQHIEATSELMHPVLLPRPAAGYHAGDLAGLAEVGVGSGCIDVPGTVWTDL